MKYFAKLLPTEGEIKEHDLVFTKFGLGTVVHIYPGNKAIEVEYKDTTRTIDEGMKPAKLFLCSRDIHVGDEYWSEKQERFITRTEQIQNLRDKKGVEDSGYKVIGEISPYAIWVREGDEFTDDDVDIIYYDRYKNFGDIEVIKIKCPKCGNFE